VRKGAWASLFFLLASRFGVRMQAFGASSRLIGVAAGARIATPAWLGVVSRPATPTHDEFLTDAGRVHAGYGGEECEESLPTYCPSGCHTRGVCVRGFCHCHPGSYGGLPPVRGRDKLSTTAAHQKE